MISFTLTTDGMSLFSSAASVLIDKAQIYNNSDAQIGTDITAISGSVVADSSMSCGGYIVISWVDLGSSSYEISKVHLLSGSTTIAVSGPVSVSKPADKTLSMRISCTFTPTTYDITKCTFNTISVNLPYATKSRVGIIRFANNDDDNLDSTAYTASDTLAKINAAISGADLDSYVPWDIVSGSPVTGNLTAEQISLTDDYSNSASSHSILLVEDDNLSIFSGGGVDIQAFSRKNITIQTSGDGHIILDAAAVGGDAVKALPVFSDSAPKTLTVSNKLITDQFISSLYAYEIPSDTSKDSRLANIGAIKSYASTLDSGAVHIAGTETITGNKTFSGNLVVNSTISGSAIYSSYDSSTMSSSANSNKIPTVGALNGAYTDLYINLSLMYTDMYDELRSDIDGINAGQNLADIVANNTSLSSLSITNLKAKNDKINDETDAATCLVGDKVQILSDSAHDYAATVYELVKGTPGASETYIASSTSGYYWKYIGNYGSDSYTKSQSDSKYIAKDHIATSAHESANDYVPSVSYMQTAISSAVTGGVTNFVKLSSDTEQEITSDLSITGDIAVDGDIGCNVGRFTTGIVAANNIKATHSNGSAPADIIGIYHTDSVFNIISYDDGGCTIGYVYGDDISHLPSAIHFSSDGHSVSLTADSYSIHFDVVTVDSSQIADVNGFFVATYEDTGSSAFLSDGRLTTVDYVNYLISSANESLLSSSNSWTNANTFNTISATQYTGTGVYSTYSSSTWSNSANANKLTTVNTVNEAIVGSIKSISISDQVGCIGLFFYTEVGAEKEIGSNVGGSYLRPAGLSLPMSGQISYKSSSSTMTGTWRLLSIAMARPSSSEPCLVLAQKINN